MIPASLSTRFRPCPEEDLMKHMHMLAVSVATLALSGFSSIAAADAAAGKAKFADACVECHEVADFEGESAQALTDSIKKIVAGQQKHKNKLTLSDTEIADLAAYIAAGK
jgi:mono/diheme cytochrome c family protein